VTRCQFSLNLSVKQCERYYTGYAKSVVARTDEGLKIAFPAAQIRQFVSHNGVRGRFEIVFDSHKRLISLTRLSF
jgi:hypothetical protein